MVVFHRNNHSETFGWIEAVYARMGAFKFSSPEQQREVHQDDSDDGDDDDD